MGNAAAKASLKTPFPVSAEINHNIDLLTTIVSRIMNTSDIYDLNNIARPGACGDYAVLLKKQVEQNLLPFVVDVSGTLIPVVYQNPTKMIKSDTMRAKICSEIADTAVRVAAIALACLASIQVVGDSREAQTVPRVQRGGGNPEVIAWLAANQYLSANAAVDAQSGKEVQLNNINDSSFGGDKYYIRFAEDRAYLTVKNNLPAGRLIVQFLNPVKLPNSKEQLLPIRVLDATGISWMSGVLYNNIYKSFSQTAGVGADKGVDPFSIWSELFRKSRDNRVAIGDMMNDALREQSNLVFEKARREPPEFIIGQLAAWLNVVTPQAQGPFGQGPYGQQPPFGTPQPFRPIQQGPFGTPPFGGPQPFGTPPFGGPQPFGTPPFGGPQPFGTPPFGGPQPVRPTQQYGIQYAIPNEQASHDILTTIHNFRDLFIKKSCPAAVRANTLSTSYDADSHTTKTGVCRDPYWTETHLGKIYPYATLQFLSVVDWSKLGESKRSDLAYVEDWDTFVNGLREIYGDRISGSGTRLDQLSFRVTPAVCADKANQTPSVRFQTVQAALAEIQAEYQAHVKQIWKIMNELVIVKAGVVQLHPNVVKRASKGYVEHIANRAIHQISTHYRNVERIYYEASTNLEQT